MNNENMENKEKKRRLLIILLGIGIAVCIAVTVWALFFRKTDSTPLIPDFAPEQTEPNAQPVTDDGSKMDVPQGGGGISIEYVSSVTVSLSENKAHFQYTHPAKSTQNIILCIMVQDTVIAKSGLISPGNQLQELTLLDGMADKLSPGTYTDAQFKILSYDPDSGEKAMVNTAAQITLTVEP